MGELKLLAWTCGGSGLGNTVWVSESVARRVSAVGVDVIVGRSLMMRCTCLCACACALCASIQYKHTCVRVAENGQL